jgi:predicted RNA-binding protein associated with RNAse of E/G family
MMTNTTLRVVWWKPGSLSPYKSLVEQISDEQRQKLIEAAATSEHNCISVTDDVIVETASKWWTEHFRLFIYLPKQYLLLRLCNDDSWYIDMGILWKLNSTVYVWTDLELDVITPKTGLHYNVLDIDEFAEAISVGEISMEMAVLALKSLHEVIQDIQAGRFPPSQVQEIILGKQAM